MVQTVIITFIQLYEVFKILISIIILKQFFISKYKILLRFSESVILPLLRGHNESKKSG